MKLFYYILLLFFLAGCGTNTIQNTTSIGNDNPPIVKKATSSGLDETQDSAGKLEKSVTEEPEEIKNGESVIVEDSPVDIAIKEFPEMDTSYTIEREEFREPHKSVFDVRLKGKLPQDALEKIANEIKENNPGFERYFVSFFLPGDDISDIHWAHVYFRPELEVRIYE